MLLFTLFINDLPNSIKFSKVSLYVDDTTIVFSDPNPVTIASVLNEELGNVSDWFAHNKLSLNAKN